MSVKSQISGYLRKTNLLSVAEKARFYWQKLKYKKDNDRFKKEHPDFVLPPEFFIYETYRLNYRWYYDDGKNTANEIITLLSKYIDLSQAGTRILDWGCGPGRIVRHFPGLLPGASIHGTDYNEKYIEWCQAHLEGIGFLVNKIVPPTAYPSEYFDVVTGLSIFTHLSEKGHHDWINELYRVIKPGKFLFITTHGAAYYTKLSDPEKKRYHANKLVTRAHPVEGNRLYSSFQPPKFTEELIAGKFEVVDYVAGISANNEPSQDNWLLRKV